MRKGPSIVPPIALALAGVLVPAGASARGVCPEFHGVAGGWQWWEHGPGDHGYFTAAIASPDIHFDYNVKDGKATIYNVYIILPPQVGFEDVIGALFPAEGTITPDARTKRENVSYRLRPGSVALAVATGSLKYNSANFQGFNPNDGMIIENALLKGQSYFMLKLQDQRTSASRYIGIEADSASFTAARSALVATIAKIEGKSKAGRCD